MFFPTALAAPRSFETARSSTEGGLAEFFSSFFAAIPFWIAAVVVLLVSFFLANIFQKIAVHRVTSKAGYDVNQEIVILIGRAVYSGTVALGLIVGFKIIGINIAALLGFLGLGLGFAFKDLLANFIAGVFILTQKKFLIGDTVRVNDIFGTITEIETRTTQIKDFDGTIHVIPNADMLTSVVQNFTAQSFRRIDFQVGVHYDTPLEQVVELTLQSVKKNKAVMVEPKTQVLVTEFADSAITLEVRFWIESRGETPWPMVQSQVMQQLKKDYDEAGVIIPFPMTTLTFDAYDEKLQKAFNVLPPVEKPFAKQKTAPAPAPAAPAQPPSQQK